MCQSHIKENEKNKGNTYTAHGTQAHTAPWTKNLYNFVVSLGCFVIFGIVNKVKHVLVAFNFAYAFWILFRLMPFPFPSIPRLYSSITSIHCIHISKPSGASSMVCKMQCGTHQLINLYIFTRTRATLEWKDDDDDSNNKQKAATTTKTTIIRNGNGNKRRRRRKREKRTPQHTCECIFYGRNFPKTKLQPSKSQTNNTKTVGVEMNIEKHMKF